MKHRYAHYPPFPSMIANLYPVGVTYVDYKNDQKRYPKKSAKSLKPLFDSLIKKD